MNTKEFTWVEKYRPTKVDDLILPADLKSQFKKFVVDRDFPNILLAGPRGMGKTSVALALMNELGSDYIKVNGSLERNIDTIRDRVAQFCSSVSFTDGRKYVILDEADGLNPLTQPALKAFIEEFSHNAGFILTANHLSKIIPELQSRCSVVEFKIPNAEKPTLAMTFMKRMASILDAEGVTYDKKALAAFIQKWFPDWRRMLNELQRYSTKGTVDTGVLASLSDSTVAELIGFMKKKEFSSVRKWVTENADVSSTELFKAFYEQSASQFTAAAVPEVVLILAKYGFQSAFAVDQEINTAAALVEIMLSVSWKD